MLPWTEIKKPLYIDINRKSTYISVKNDNRYFLLQILDTFGLKAAAPGESPIVEETARSAHHSSSHSELSQRQSPQQSQRSLTAAVAANLAYSRNQPVSHVEPVSLTMLLSSLRASLASQQPDGLIQGSLCDTRTSTSNYPC